MRWRAELSAEAERQLSKFPRNIQTRLSQAIDELEARDDAQWTNVKSLHGPEWKGRFRKRVGHYRIIFKKHPEHGSIQISAILLRSKDTYH